jgi:hypothetical protein
MNAITASRRPGAFSWSANLGLSMMLGLAAVCAPSAARAKGHRISPYVSKAVATYNIRFNGIEIGNFKFWSNLTTSQYTLSAKASVSLLLGIAFDWKGITSSSGMVTANGPIPTNYDFRYETNDKREQIRLRFAKNTVSEVLLNPPKHPKPGRVPITAQHLHNVVDPLSAVILLSRMTGAKTGGAAACERRLPIFDGKMRYDLIFSYKATRRLQRAGGYHGPAYICKVKFVAIAGHKPERKKGVMSSSANIEVWLVPIPDAHLVVPYHVSIPTAAGVASVTSERFEILTAARGRRRALVF